MRRNFFRDLRPGALSLKTVLAIYFVPISVLPSIFISYYAIREFKDSTRETLIRRARSERDAIVAEIESLEGDLLAEAIQHAGSARLVQALKRQDGASLAEVLA